MVRPSSFALVTLSSSLPSTTIGANWSSFFTKDILSSLHLSSDFGQGQLRCFDTVSRRPYPCLSVALKVILSLSDPQVIFTSD